jgi:hypothetical protein
MTKGSVIGVSTVGRYRPQGNTGDLAAIVTQVDGDGTVSLTIFAPGSGPSFYNRIKVDGQGGPQSAKAGHFYVW